MISINILAKKTKNWYKNNMKNTSHFILCILYLALAGCAAVPIALTGGTIALTTDQIASKRSIKGIWDDYFQKSAVRKIWLDHKLELIPCVVQEDTVMIYGAIKSNSNEYISLAKSIKGIKHVIDFTYQSAVQSENFLSDKMLKTKIKTLLVADKNVQSRNYYIRVLNSVVYVLGIAYTFDEKEKFINVVSNVNGVKRLEHHIIIAPGKKTKMLPN